MGYADQSLKIISVPLHPAQVEKTSRIREYSVFLRGEAHKHAYSDVLKSSATLNGTFRNLSKMCGTFSSCSI